MKEWLNRLPILTSSKWYRIGSADTDRSAPLFLDYYNDSDCQHDKDNKQRTGQSLSQ